MAGPDVWSTSRPALGRPAHPPPRRFTPPALPAASRRTETMARARGSPPHIHKFGGASLANAAGITHAAKIVVAYRPAPQVVVVSAMSGVTYALLECAARGSRGHAAHGPPAAKTLRARHVEAAQAPVRR